MRKLTLEEIRENARRHGGRCLSSEYVGSLALMEWECGKGHRWKATAHSVRQGHWCKRCADARLRFPAEHAAEIAAAHGGKCLSPYTNTATRMQWSCARGHEWLATLTAVKQGRWCPACSGRTPRRERRARSWVSAISVPMPDSGSGR
jgi:hypothetical protein